MLRRMTLEDYLRTEETNRPQELAYGLLREPPAPSFDHQVIVGRLYRRLSNHVERYRLGVVAMSPIDVVLDAKRALVVQPDVLFVSSSRRNICTDRVWGPPDLAIEVLSMGNARRDRTIKVPWYREYGVRECWLADTASASVTVLELAAPERARAYEARQIVKSAVLSRLRLKPADIFTPR